MCRNPATQPEAIRPRENGGVLTQEHLIGRDAELAAIREAVASAVGGGGVLLLRGEAGVGKSALLADAAVTAAAAGTRVLRVTGVRTEAHLPFAGLHQLLRPLLGGLDGLPPPQRTAIGAAFGLADGAVQDPFLIALAALTLLTDAAAAQPILALVDDAQWLDRASDEAVAFVARRLGADPVTFLFAVRDGDGSTAVESAGLPVVDIAPLEDANARTLLGRTAANLGAAVRERILREAAGNPLALIELPAALAGRTPDAPDAGIDPLPVTARIERAVADRLSDMPAATARMLLVAALHDHGTVDEISGAASGAGLADANETNLAPAVDRGLIALDDGSVRFRHPLVRSAILQRATDADRRSAHLALASVAQDPDRVAWHRAAAATTPDEATAALLDGAARRAEQRGALPAAVASLEQAARLSADGRARGTRLLRAADLAYEIGRFDITARLLGEAGSFETDALEARRQAWLLALELTGPKTTREERNIRLVIDAAQRIAADDVDLARRLLEFAAARSWWMDVDPALASGVLEAAREIVPGQDDPLLVYVTAAAAQQQGPAVLERLRRRLAADEPLDPNTARLLGISAMWVGDLDTAAQFFALFGPASRSQGRLGFLARAQILSGWCATHLGRLTEAAPALDEGLRLAVETDQENFIATAHMALAQHHALRGDVESGTAAAAEAERHSRQAYADGLLANLYHARGMLELAAERHADAFDTLRHIYEPGDEGSHPFVRSWAIADMVDASIPAGRTADAARYVDALDNHAGLAASPWQRISMAYARAVLAADRGDDEAAEAGFRRALAADLERWPLARARLLLAYGSWLRRRRRVAESRDPLRSSREMLDAIGVPWMADRARRELGATGEVSKARSPKSVDELTPQELQIARLAASGLSNRDIGERLYLSHRTVGFHLYHVYPKLGISGRAQLHAALGAA